MKEQRKQAHSSRSDLDTRSEIPVHRLSTWTGLWLILFVTLHMTLMSQGLGGRGALEAGVRWWHRIPGYPWWMTLLVVLPLGLHAWVGLSRVAERAPWGRWAKNTRLSLDAIHVLAGLLVGIFVVVHVATIGGPAMSEGVGPGFVFDALSSTLSSTQMAVPWHGLLYLAAALALGFHAGNGLWRVLRRGVCGRKSRSWCAGLVALGALAWTAVTVDLVVYYSTATVLFRLPVEEPRHGAGQVVCPESEIVLDPLPKPATREGTSVAPKPAH